MFDNLLQLAADDDRATLTTMAGKYPTLRKYFELGEKLEPVADRLRALGPNYVDNLALPVDELEKWRGWKANDWTAWETQHNQIQEALGAANIRIAELEASRGTDMTQEEVEQIVTATLKKVGIVDKATLDSTLQSFAKDTIGPTLDRSVNGLTQRFEDVYAMLTPKVRQHEKEFGEDLDVKAVFDHMKKTGQMDPIKAYNEMYAPKFAEKSKVQTEAEKKAEYEKGLAEGRKAAAKEMGANRSPVDGGGDNAPQRRGALMRRAEARMPKKADGDMDTSKIPLGKGIARAATQEYYDRKAGAAVQ